MLNTGVKVLLQPFELAVVHAVKILEILSSRDEVLFQEVVVFNEDLIGGQRASASAAVSAASLKLTVAALRIGARLRLSAALWGPAASAASMTTATASASALARIGCIAAWF